MDAAAAFANRDSECAAYEVLDEELPAGARSTNDELELLRIRAGTPRYGRELDDRVLPAEAGLDARAIDFEKGCYPGQEPIARQHYRGRVTARSACSSSKETSYPSTTPSSSSRARSSGASRAPTRDGDRSSSRSRYVRAEVRRDAAP